LSTGAFSFDYQALTRARQSLGRLTEADLHKSIEGLEETPRELTAWILALIESGRGELVVALCVRGLEREPNQDAYMILLAVGLSLIGESSEGLVVLERVFELLEPEEERYQLALSCAARLQLELSQSGSGLDELPTFNMSTPEIINEFTDTSLSLIKVREWLDGSEMFASTGAQELGDELLDGPTENLDQASIQRLARESESQAHLIDVTESVDFSSLELMEMQSTESLSGSSVLSSVMTEPLDSGSFATISELSVQSPASQSSSWELSESEAELLERRSAELTTEPSSGLEQPDTLSVYELDESLDGGPLHTNVAERGPTTQPIHPPRLSLTPAPMRPAEELTAAVDSSDETRGIELRDELSTVAQTRALEIEHAERDVMTSALTQLQAQQLPSALTPDSEDAVITRAHEPVTPPIVPPMVPPPPPSMVMKVRPPSLPPSHQRPPPSISDPSISPPSISPPPVHKPKSARRAEEQLNEPASTRALPAQTESDAFNRGGLSPSTRELPEREQSLAADVGAESPSTRAIPAELRSLAPKPLDSLRSPVAEPPPAASSGAHKHQRSVEERLSGAQVIAGARHESTSMFMMTEDQPISQLSSARPAAGSSSVMWSALLVIISGLVLSLGLGFQKQTGLLREGVNASLYMSDEGYRELSERLMTDHRQPGDWPLILAEQLSAQLGLRSGAGGELEALRAWVEMSLWVGYGRDEHQEQAISALLSALSSAPRSPYTLGALSLYLSAMSAHEAAIKIAEGISHRSWLRGLSLGLSYAREGYAQEAVKELGESDLLNPSATLTQQLILSAFDSYGDPRSVVELQGRGARFGLSEEQLIWSTPSLIAQGERSAKLPPFPEAPLLQAWGFRALFLGEIEPPQPWRVLLNSALSELRAEPKSRLIPTALRYARLTLNHQLLERAPQLIEERYQAGLISLTERELSLSELALARGDVSRQSTSSRYSPHPQLSALIPELLALYPELSASSLEQQVSSQSMGLMSAELERLLIAQAWSLLHVALNKEGAKGLNPMSFKRLELFTKALSQREVKSLSAQLKQPGALRPRDPLTAVYPDELLLSYAMNEAGQAERAVRFASTFSAHPSLSPEAQLNTSLFICRALSEVALLPSQWLACKSSFERAPYRFDAIEGYTLLLEELGELDEAERLLSAGLSDQMSAQRSVRLERLLTRLQSARRAGAQLVGTQSPELKRYQAALQLLRDGLYMSGARALSQLPQSTRHERFEISALSARLQGGLAALERVASRGSLGAQLYLWLMGLGQGLESQATLSLNAVIGSPQVARLTELVDLMSCFAREDRLDLHHMTLAQSAAKRVRALPPPAACRASFHSLLKGSFNEKGFPPYALHAVGLLFLSVGELKSAVALWSAQLNDPIRSLEARLALGLLSLRQGDRGQARELWAPLMKERTPLATELTQALSR